MNYKNRGLNTAVNKVVVTEPIDRSGIELLKKEAEVLYLPDMPGRKLTDVIRDAQAIVVRVAKIDRAVIEAGEQLLVIAKHGVGYDNIDVGTATKRKIVVVNTPAANAESVIEHNIGFMLSLSKKITAVDHALRTSNFKNRELFTGVEMDGKTLGVIGLGRIGMGVADKCKAAFNMDVLVYDPYASKDRVAQSGFKKIEKLDDLLGAADYVVICVPLTDETANLIRGQELNLMKPTAFLVNSSRGGIVDEAALYEYLSKGKLAGAAIDTFKEEPPTLKNPLLSLDNFIATPHTAGVTNESMKRIAIALADDVLLVLRGERPHFPVNAQVYIR
jgi:D-3-phosphoglycerate dehydrogenase / 2-oxoglutarate reductase